MGNEYYQAWADLNHLKKFSDYQKNLRIYNKYTLEKLYCNLGIGLRLILPYVNSVNEIGPGGGRTYSYFREILAELKLSEPSYLGYEVSSQCVDALRDRYGDLWALCDPAKPNYRNADLVYFFDVLVHSTRPLAMLDELSNSCRKYLCFQTPTRDEGQTEIDPEKSCRLENGEWVPWIVFNLTELIDHLRGRGFTRFLIQKQYKQFAGNGPRYLPKDLFHDRTGTARTAILAIKSDQLEPELLLTGLFDKEITVNIPETEIRVPKVVRLLNWAHRRTNG